MGDEYILAVFRKKQSIAAVPFVVVGG